MDILWKEAVSFWCLKKLNKRKADHTHMYRFSFVLFASIIIIGHIMTLFFPFYAFFGFRISMRNEQMISGPDDVFTSLTHTHTHIGKPNRTELNWSFIWERWMMHLCYLIRFQVLYDLLSSGFMNSHFIFHLCMSGPQKQNHLVLVQCDYFSD